MTFTPNEVGDWLVIITFQARHTNTGDSFEVRVELDDTYTICLPNQEPEINNQNLEYRTFGHFRVFQDLSCSEHHVDVDYRTQDSGTTMYIKNVRIVAVQIEDIDGVNNAYQEAEGGVKGSTDWTDTVEASITPADTNKKYLVVGCLEVQPSTSKSYYAQARISVDDTTYIPVEAPAGKYWTSTTKDLGDWFHLMGYAVVTLTSGVHAVALQIKGDTTYSDYRYRRILVLRLDDVYEYEYVSNPTENSQTGTTWKDASSLQFTSSASDYLILASMCGRLDTSGSSFQHRFTIGGVSQVDHLDHFEEQSDASYRSFQYAEIKTLLAESQTFKNRFRACDETRTAYVKESVIVAIKRPLPVDTPPCWSNAGTNNTVAGEPTLFHVKWIDNAGLSGFIFGTNNTGTWANNTWTPMSGTTDWSNITKILNSDVGVTVQWRVWANDTSNNLDDTGVLSLTTTRAVTTQLGLCFDGSGSISSSEFAIITAGIAAAVRNASQLPHDGTVELTVVQFGTGITAYARVEVAPTAVTSANFESIATTIEGISQIGGYTPTADGLLLTWLQMGGSTNFAIATRQVINVASNGFANRELKATPPVSWPTPPGTAWGDVSYVRDNAAAEGLDEIDAEGIGVTEESLADMRDCLVYPQPGTIAPPYNPGWVRWVANATEFAAAVGEKFIIVLQQPVACFTVSNDHPNVCETVTFNATCSYDPDGTIVKYEWDWDGDCVYDFDAGDNPIATHHYDTHGYYYPKLRVTDNDSLTDETNTTIQVRAHPVASFTWTPEKPQVCETVTFNASASTPDGGVIVSWDWNFGDNTTGSGEIVTHHYDNYGNYTVTLNVTDSEGKWDTESKDITVRAHPHADFTWSPTSPKAGELVTFNGSLSTPDGGTIISYEWDFGDNSPSVFGKIVTHTYSTNGTYTVTLNVTDSEGKWDTESKSITVRPLKWCLTVKTDPPGLSPAPTPPSNWYINCTYVNLTAQEYANVSADTRYRFHYWDVNDTSQGVGVKNITLHMDANYTATAHYIPQYLVTFNHTGLDSTANSAVVTVNGAPKDFIDLPFSMWADNGSSVTYSYSAIVSSTISGKRFRLDSISSPSSPFTVTGPVTITGNYKTQYLLTVRTSGLGTEVTNVYNNTNVLGTATDATPYSDWFDEGSSLEIDVDTPITVGSTRFVFIEWSGDATGTTRPLPISMNSAKDITADYKTQYEVCFDQSGVGTDFTGTVVTIDGTGYNVTDLPVCFWWDKDSGHSFSFASPLVVNAGKQYVWVSTSGLSTLQSDTLTITSSGIITGNYAVLAKYEITFDQTGVSSDFTGTLVVIDGADYGVGSLPVSFLWDAGSVHSFAFQSPLVVTPDAKRYLWTSTSGLSSLQSNSITVSTSGNVIGNYKTQYYLTVTSPYGDPTPISGWFDAGTVITASVTSPWPGATGVRYVCTGWTGTGSVPASGTGTSMTFTINEPSSITWNWKTQYLLTVRTSPTGLSPQPTRSPAGEAGAGGWWYDNCTDVVLTAQTVTGYTFLNWDVDGPTVSGNPITVHMHAPHTATAHYRALPQPAVGGEMILIKVDKPVVGPPGVELAIALLTAVVAVAVLVKWRRKT